MGGGPTDFSDNKTLEVSDLISSVRDVMECDFNGSILAAYICTAYICKKKKKKKSFLVSFVAAFRKSEL